MIKFVKSKLEMAFNVIGFYTVWDTFAIAEGETFYPGLLLVLMVSGQSFTDHPSDVYVYHTKVASPH